MKQFRYVFLALTLVFSSSAHALSLGTTKALTIGGRVFDASEIAMFESKGVTGIVLVSEVLTPQHGTSFADGSGSPYQVTAVNGMDCLALKASYANGVTASSQGLRLAYSTALVTFDMTSPTSPTTFGTGATTGFGFAALQSLAAASGGAGEWSFLWHIPQNKYPFMYAGNASAGISATIWCKIL